MRIEDLSNKLKILEEKSKQKELELEKELAKLPKSEIGKYGKQLKTQREESKGSQERSK